MPAGQAERLIAVILLLNVASAACSKAVPVSGRDAETNPPARNTDTRQDIGEEEAIRIARDALVNKVSWSSRAEFKAEKENGSWTVLACELLPHQNNEGPQIASRKHCAVIIGMQGEVIRI